MCYANHLCVSGAGGEALNRPATPEGALASLEQAMLAAIELHDTYPTPGWQLAQALRASLALPPHPGLLAMQASKLDWVAFLMEADSQGYSLQQVMTIQSLLK